MVHCHAENILCDGSFLTDEDFGEGQWSVPAYSLVAVESESVDHAAVLTGKGKGQG